jgi:hypothetical protein
VTTRLGEFATGTGGGVLVDRKNSGAHYVHLDASCPAIGRNRVGTFATEKTARAAVAGVKACRTCR